MSATVQLYDPTAPMGGVASESAGRHAGLAGMVVGFIDNAKPNFNHLVDDLAELFVSRHGAKGSMKRQKRSPAVAAPEAFYRELSEQCGLVITGSGD